MRNFRFYIFLAFIILSTPISAKTVIEVIESNKDLSIFNTYLKKTGIDEILKKKLPWNWTIFAPSNAAFKSASLELKNQILDDEILSKNILMDHMMAGHYTSLDVSEEVTTQITVSNKPLQIYKSRKLHVKDMVVVQENLIGNNGVVHVIDCIMFVQPSKEDDRVSKDIEKEFPITSCCMRDSIEIKSFKDSVKSKF